MANEIDKLREYLLSVVKIEKETALKALKDQIDVDAYKVYNQLRDTAPTESVKNSIKIDKLPENGRRYGYVIYFDGYSPNSGVSYDYIANMFNRGNANIRPTYFVTRAKRTLKGLDKRAYYRYELMIGKELS